MKKILILGAGLLQIPVIYKAKELGIYTIVADGDPNASGLSLADKPVVVDITDPEALLSIALAEEIDGVIHPCSEVAMNAMGTINEKLGLKGINLETAVQATNKEKMRRAFEVGNAPSPLSRGASTKEEALQVVQEIEGDVIVKPSRNSGSRGVTRLSAHATAKEVIMAFERGMDNSRDHSVVIEQYIDGPEFSVEIVIWNNEPHVLTVTDKLTTGSPYFVEMGHSQPSQYSEKEQMLIKKAAIEGCKALGLDWCVAHAEVKLQKERPYIMEIGARLGGDFISTELVHLSTGIDMVAAAIHLSLGTIPDLSPKHAPQGAAIRYFAPETGVLLKLKVPDDSTSSQVAVYIREGDTIPALRSSLDRSGHVISVGKDAHEAIRKATLAISKIEYQVR